MNSNCPVLCCRTTKSARQKRYVSVIPIEGARPHHLTQGPLKGTTQESVYHFNDRQDFEQLVELQDDGVRVSILSFSSLMAFPKKNFTFGSCDHGNGA